MFHQTYSLCYQGPVYKLPFGRAFYITILATTLSLSLLLSASVNYILSSH